MTRRLHLTALEERTAPSATLLNDINRDTDFGSMATLGNAILFVQSTPETGAELWRTDGTPEGTALVKDIVPGVAGSSPQFYREVGGQMYFTITTATSGEALWRTDGTAAGTVALKTIRSNPNNNVQINSLVEFKGQVYFGLYSAGRPGSLWKSNGTAAGTTMIAPFGWTSTDPLNDFGPAGVSDLTVVGDTLYFVGETRRHGEALWRTNGTPAGTRPVSNSPATQWTGDQYIYKLNIHPVRMTAFNGELYFAGKAFGSELGTELWRTDGTAAGTELVKDIRTGSSSSAPWEFTVVGSTLFFAANDGTTGLGLGNELWKSDGTTTTLVKDINISTNSGLSSGTGARLTVHNNKLYFLANNGTTGKELWTSDGSFGGTTPVKDINPNLPSSEIPRPVSIGGLLYFYADDGSTGQEVWTSDGSLGGTNRLIDLEPGAASSFPFAFAELNGDVYWFANTIAQGQALWKSNGTEAGTTLVLSSPGHSTGDSSPSRSVFFNGATYFTANDSLWKTDGTTADTTLVKSGSFTGGTYFEGDIHSDINLIVFQGALYLSGTDPTNGTELWKSDGTASGTALFKDINGGSGSSNPGDFLVSGGILYFGATNAASGLELWSSNGTPGGTNILKEIGPTTTGGLSKNMLFEFGGRIYFSANDGSTGFELWTSNGTSAGTTIVKDIYPNGAGGLSSYNAQTFASVGNDLYFWAQDPNEGTNIWKTDGTEAGTERVTDIVTGINSISPLAVRNGRVYFINASVNKRALWEIDPATGLVTKVKALPVSLWFESSELFTFDEQLYFLNYDAAHGAELWTSDGTAAGTRLFRDIAPGPKSAFRVPAFGDPDLHFYTLGISPGFTSNGFVFQATDGKQTTDGVEHYSVWWTDGAPDGTRAIMNSIMSKFMGTVNDKPLLAAYTTEHGREPYLYTPIATTTDHYTLEDGRRLDVPAATGVLANDMDGESTPAKALLVAGPTNGWLDLNADGSFSYQPFSVDFSGTDTFTYRAAGDVEQSTPTTVTISIDLTNQNPTPEDDTAIGRSSKSALVNVLANDRDPDHDSLSIDSFSQGTSGKVKKVRTKLLYTPTIAGALTDSFTYTVRDSRGGTTTATVNISLTTVAGPRVTSIRVFPGSGSTGVSITTPRKVLPFAQLSRVEITFSAGVAVNADDLRLFGSVGSYTLSGFSYNATTRIASWQIDANSAMRNDRLTFLLDGSVSGVTHSGGAPLGDGFWNASLIAGDFNRNGTVTSADTAKIKARYGAATGARFYADINGDGMVDAMDYNLALAMVGQRV